jgi:hypothetical protein
MLYTSQKTASIEQLCELLRLVTFSKENASCIAKQQADYSGRVV